MPAGINYDTVKHRDGHPSAYTGLHSFSVQPKSSLMLDITNNPWAISPSLLILSDCRSLNQKSAYSYSSIIFPGEGRAVESNHRICCKMPLIFHFILSHLPCLLPLTGGDLLYRLFAFFIRIRKKRNVIRLRRTSKRLSATRRLEGSWAMLFQGRFSWLISGLGGKESEIIDDISIDRSRSHGLWSFLHCRKTKAVTMTLTEILPYNISYSVRSWEPRLSVLRPGTCRLRVEICQHFSLHPENWKLTEQWTP